MLKRNLLVSLLVISSCFLIISVQGQKVQSPFDTSSANLAGTVANADSELALFGSQELPEAQHGEIVKSAEQPVADGKSRVHQYHSNVVLQLRDNQKPFENGYYFSLVEEREDQELCKANRFKRCYLAIGHGYEQPIDTTEKPTVNPPKTVAAYLGFNEDNNFNIAFETTAGETWRPLLARVADKVNPLNEPSTNSDCDSKVQIPDVKTTKSQYAQTSVRDRSFPHLIASQTETYDFDLQTDIDDVSAENEKLKPEKLLGQYQREVKLGGKATFSFEKVGYSKDIPRQNLSSYRLRLKSAKFQSKASIQRDIQKAAQLRAEPDTGVDPDFTQLDILQDQNGNGAIDFEKYLKGEGKFEEDYKRLISSQQTRVLTFEEPERLLEDSNGQAQRLLPVIATHTIYEQTKVLYSKTILGKTIEVKFYGKCQLIISAAPSKHEIYCFGQLRYKVFSFTQTKTLFSFTKLIATNWSWVQNWAGSWGFTFSVPLPPPVSFITINFYVNVGYSISLNLSSSVTQWWYPLIHEVKAVASTSLTADATATLKVVAVEGGVFIQGTIVKVSTDPTCTLYYYLQQQHRLIIFWIKWYWELLAFQFEWGFKWRYWFFGWKPWKTIAKWTITNGITNRYKILEKVFWINY